MSHHAQPYLSIPSQSFIELYSHEMHTLETHDNLDHSDQIAHNQHHIHAQGATCREIE